MDRYIREIFFLGSEYEKEVEQLKSVMSEKDIIITSIEDVDKTSLQQGTLWITDDADKARELLSQNEAVLFYLDTQKVQDTTGILYCIEGFEDIDLGYLEQVYCRQKELPWYVLETERLILREITVDDVERLYELYADKEITRYMEDLFSEYQEEYKYTQQYIKNIYGFYGYGMWVVVDKENNEVIGRAGVENREGFDGVELGFMLGKAYQHKGYAYEICKAILQYGVEYLGMEEYYALVQPGNVDSVRLLCKLGFQLEELRKEHDMTYQVFRLQIGTNQIM